MRFLRGTAFDVFGYTQERREERQLVLDYQRQLLQLLPGLTTANRDLVVAWASLPERIRGFGHVKAASVAIARAKQQELLDQLRGIQVASVVVEEKRQVETV